MIHHLETESRGSAEQAHPRQDIDAEGAAHGELPVCVARIGGLFTGKQNLAPLAKAVTGDSPTDTDERSNASGGTWGGQAHQQVSSDDPGADTALGVNRLEGTVGERST